MEPLWRRALILGMVLAFATGYGVGQSFGRSAVPTPDGDQEAPTPTLTVRFPLPTALPTFPPRLQRRYNRHPWLHGIAPRPQRHILGWFANVEEDQLPDQGVLGGEMSPGLIVFPSGFEGTKEDRYFVYGSDGHISLTWIFRGDSIQKPIATCGHVDRAEGCPSLRALQRLHRKPGFDAWLLQPPYFVPYRNDR